MTRINKVIKVGISAVLAVFAIISGNLFWYLFAQQLKTEHLFTNSSIKIALSLTLPIILFGIYIVCILFFSFFMRKRIMHLVVIILSFSFYPFMLSSDFIYTDILSGIGSSLAIFWFLFAYNKVAIKVNDAFSFSTQMFFALSGTTLLITLMTGFVFYNFYKDVLTENDIILSDQFVSEAFAPISQVYIAEFGTSRTETFAAYIKRQAQLTKQPESDVREQTLNKLGLKNVNSKSSMGIVIELSLRNMVFKVTNTYKKQISVFLSLGLAAIIQTVMTVGAFLSIVFGRVLLWLFIKKLKLLSVENGKIAHLS